MMAVLAGVLFAVAAGRGPGEHVRGLKVALGLSRQMVPILVCALVVAGMMQVLIPRELIGRWVGTESGMRGILIGSAAGAFAPGGPYVNLPIAAGLLQSGAGIGTMIAFLTSWSVIAIHRMPMEVGILGWKFTLVRLACSLLFPLAAGVLAWRFFSWVK
ncbi:MAG: permease [Planctomycetes bacterium]|nr:permease [Planctomycetota bacterium]